MNPGAKILVGIIAAIVVLLLIMRWLDPGPLCYGDSQCADLRASHMEHD
jgi:hypothetical protein